MERGRLTWLGRWIWGVFCLGIAALAFFYGGFVLVSWIAVGILAYALVVAVVATLALGFESWVPRGGDENRSHSLAQRFTTSFQAALIDGPFLFLLMVS